MISFTIVRHLKNHLDYHQHNIRKNKWFEEVEGQ